MPRGRPKGKRKETANTEPKFFKSERTLNDNGWFGPGGSDMSLREAFERVIAAVPGDLASRDKEAFEIIKALARGSYGVKV